jgi:photosystem II stability/assembly factor-like uncharacterized protein
MCPNAVLHARSLVFGAGLVSGLLSARVDAAAPPQPGVWGAVTGDFARLNAVLVLRDNDIWAVGDGIVHFDGRTWRQVAGRDRPMLNGIDATAPDSIWVVGEAGDGVCNRYGLVMHYDGSNWRTEPLLTHQPLFDVRMISSQSGWAVGGLEQATIVRYDGRRWVPVPVPRAGGLRAVHMLDENTGWAVGESGAILRYDGSGWSAVGSPTRGVLLDVHMLDESFGWAVGMEDWSGIALVYDEGMWEVDLHGRTPSLAAVHTIERHKALAVGEQGVLVYFDGVYWREVGRTYPGGYGIYSDPARGDAETVDAARDGGTPERFRHGVVSEVVSAGMPAGDGSLAAPPAWRGYGRAAPRLAHGNGFYAPEVTYGAYFSDMLNALRPLPPLAGDPDGPMSLLAVGDYGQVVRIDGRDWTEVHAGEWYVAIDMLSPRHGWAIGSAGRPMSWDGTNWTRHSMPLRAGDRLTDVDAVTSSAAWAVGTRGLVVRWDGAGWRRLPRLTLDDLVAVSFSTPTDGWVISNTYGTDEDPSHIRQSGAGTATRGRRRCGCARHGYQMWRRDRRPMCGSPTVECTCCTSTAAAGSGNRCWGTILWTGGRQVCAAWHSRRAEVGAWAGGRWCASTVASGAKFRRHRRRLR